MTNPFRGRVEANDFRAAAHQLGTFGYDTISSDREGLHIAMRAFLPCYVMFVISLGMLAGVWVNATFSVSGLNEFGWI